MADFETYVREKLEAIHTQVTATNGRVNALEKWRDDISPVITEHEKKVNKVSGGINVLSFVLGSSILFIVLKYISGIVR
jgi:hypothetical protein